MPIRRFQSWEEVCALIAHFEIGDLPHAEWNHGAHLTVAFWYLSRLDRAQATERIRSGIPIARALPTPITAATTKR